MTELFNTEHVVSAYDARSLQRRREAGAAVAKIGFTVPDKLWSVWDGEYDRWWCAAPIGVPHPRGGEYWVAYEPGDGWGSGVHLRSDKSNGNWRLDGNYSVITVRLKSAADLGAWLLKQNIAVRTVVGAKERVTRGTVTIPAFEQSVREARAELEAIDRARGIELPPAPPTPKWLTPAMNVREWLTCVAISFGIIIVALIIGVLTVGLA